MDCYNNGTNWDLKHSYNLNKIDCNYKVDIINANVIKLSGCTDSQHSYNVYTSGKYQVAFTNCFIKSIETEMNNDLISLAYKISDNLTSGGWSAQTSKLSSSFYLYKNNRFF